MPRHTNDHELMLWLDDELPARRRSQIAQHIDACPACRQRVDRFRATLRHVGTFYRDEHGASSQEHDYGRVRLAAALREAALSRPGWWDRAPAVVGRWLVVRDLAVGAVVLAVSAAALIGVRALPHAAPWRVPPGALPDSSFTPGAVSALTSAELCNGVRPPRIVTGSVRLQVLRAYGMERVPDTAYELDALITPELGGSTDPANLWPQRYHSPVWNARVKDELERLLPEMVCSRQITLAQAQQDIAADWIAAYKRYFRTDVPLQSHLGPSEEDEADLLFVDDRPMLQHAVVRVVSR